MGELRWEVGQLYEWEDSKTRLPQGSHGRRGYGKGEME
jgi:hypothetical protein